MSRVRGGRGDPTLRPCPTWRPWAAQAPGQRGAAPRRQSHPARNLGEGRSPAPPSLPQESRSPTLHSRLSLALPPGASAAHLRSRPNFRAAAALSPLLLPSPGSPSLRFPLHCPLYLLGLPLAVVPFTRRPPCSQSLHPLLCPPGPPPRCPSVSTQLGVPRRVSPLSSPSDNLSSSHFLSIPQSPSSIPPLHPCVSPYPPGPAAEPSYPPFHALPRPPPSGLPASVSFLSRLLPCQPPFLEGGCASGKRRRRRAERVPALPRRPPATAMRRLGRGSGWPHRPQVRAGAAARDSGVRRSRAPLGDSPGTSRQGPDLEPGLPPAPVGYRTFRPLLGPTFTLVRVPRPQAVTLDTY